jgi:hypothetical protein
MRRVTVLQKWKFIYQFQQYYLPVLYGLLGLKVRISGMCRSCGGDFCVSTNPRFFILFFGSLFLVYFRRFYHSGLALFIPFLDQISSIRCCCG